MLKRSCALLLTLLFSASVFAVTAGDEAPSWTGINENGEEISFPADIPNKPTVMVFWATWCPYCKAFMPNLAEIQKDYGEENINVVLINHKERGAGDPAAYVKTLDFANTAIIDADDIGDAYAMDFIPGLLVIDAAGTVAWRRASTELPAGKTVAELWESQVRSELDRLLLN